MNLFLVLKFLHITAMFFAVAAALGEDIVFRSFARRGDVAGLRALAPVVAIVERFVPLLFVVGLVFGLLAAWTGELNLLSPWLLIAYALFASAMTVGALVAGPWAKSVAEAALASPTDAPSPELRAAAADRRGIVGSATLVLVVIAIVFVMVFKPLS